MFKSGLLVACTESSVSCLVRCCEGGEVIGACDRFPSPFKWWLPSWWVPFDWSIFVAERGSCYSFSGVEGSLAGVHFDAVFCLDAQRGAHNVFRLSVRTCNVLKVSLNVSFADLFGHPCNERDGEETN